MRIILKGRCNTTDLTTWLLDNSDRLYRYWIYKRMWTPYEQEQKFTDESIYQDDECCFGRIVEAVELPDGDVLLGFADPDCSSFEYVSYYKLSDIEIAYCERDQHEEDEEDEEDS